MPQQVERLNFLPDPKDLPWDPTPQQAPSMSYPSMPAESEFGTDTDTASSWGEPLDYQAPDLSGLTPEQQDEYLYWTYTQAKSRWRRHMQKPVRKVRRFIKLKGRGKGQGKRRFSFLLEASDETVNSVFFRWKRQMKK